MVLGGEPDAANAELDVLALALVNAAHGLELVCGMLGPPVDTFVAISLQQFTNSHVSSCLCGSFMDRTI